MMDELWRSQEDMEIHLRSEDYLKVLLVVEMALKTPEFRFDTIACSSGVNTIEKARDAP
jgi:quinol monooxygenase YgiN